MKQPTGSPDTTRVDSRQVPGYICGHAVLIGNGDYSHPKVALEPFEPGHDPFEPIPCGACGHDYNYHYYCLVREIPTRIHIVFHPTVPIAVRAYSRDVRFVVENSWEVLLLLVVILMASRELLVSELEPIHG